MTVMNRHVEISIQGDDNPNLTVKHLKGALRKIKPWGGIGWDQLAALWWKKITSVHNVLFQIVTRLVEKGECPWWETLGRTVLIGEKGKTLEKAEHYRPITCLSVIYKIQTAIINNILRDHIFRNKICPFEQLGTLEGTFGANEAILFDRYIAKEVKLYRRNLTAAR